MRQIASIQALRALAALMVVVGHAQTEAIVLSTKQGLGFTPLSVLPWGAGVDLFFVISGFIMVVSSEALFGLPNASATFATRRLKRIVPLYWLATTLYVLIQLAMHKPVGGGDLLASYLFWPRDVHGDGILRPIFALGWTLNYEMFFYVLFSLAVCLPRRRACGVVFACLATGVCMGQVLSIPFDALVFWTRPIVLEFALGMGIALLWRRGVRASDPARLGLAGLGVLGLAYDAMGSAHQAVTWTTPTDLTRLLGWGVPAALLVAAAAFGREKSSAKSDISDLLRQKKQSEGGVSSVAKRLRCSGLRVPTFLVALGDSSYALYLLHPFVVLSLTRVYPLVGLAARFGYWPYIGICAGLAILCALVVHRCLEIPLARRLALRRLEGRRVVLAR